MMSGKSEYGERLVFFQSLLWGWGRRIECFAQVPGSALLE